MGLRHCLNSQATSLLLIAILNASCSNGPAGPTPETVLLSRTSIAFLDTDEQPVTITNLGNEPIDWRIHSSSASWLNASPAIGSVGSRGSGTLTVHIDRRAVSKGTHTAVLQIRAGSDVLSLNVTVEESAAEPYLEPGSLVLGPLAETGIIDVVNPGPSRLEWNLASSAPWATLSASTGNAPAGGSSKIVVTVNRTGLPPGKYVGTLHLTSSAGSSSATITSEVGGGAAVHLEPASLNFGLSNTQLPLRIVNDGYEPLNWSAQPGATWISLSTTGGQISARSSALVPVSVNRTGLTYGLHEAGIQFLTNAGAAAATVTTMAVPTGSSPTPPAPRNAAIEIQPKSLDFGESATELSLLVFNAGDEALDWTGSTDKGWTTISPSSGRVSPHSGTSVTVRVSRAGLTGGIYQSNVTFSSNGGSASTIVKMGVASNAPAPGPDDPGPDPPPPPGPAQIELSQTSLDFGKVTTELNLVVKNKGGVPLDWSAQASSGWLTLSSTSGRVSPGATGQTIIVRTLRTGLFGDGLYNGSIAFTSNGGAVIVPVVLEVASPPPSSIPKLSDIDATGTKDVTNELNAYLASVPNGSVIELPAGAKYRVEGSVFLADRHNLTIEGNGALIFAITDGSGVPKTPGTIDGDWPRTRGHVRIKGGSGIVIRNLNVRGANPNAGMSEEAYVAALEAQHAFSINGGATDIELDHVSASDVYGDFVYIGGGNAQPWNRNIHIHDSHFERNGRQGIAITRGQGVLIERNYISITRRATFDLEPGSEDAGAMDVVIRDNEIGPGRLAFVASKGVGPNVSFTIQNNILHRGMGTSVRTGESYRRGPIRIIGNISDVEYRSSSPVLEFYRVDGVEVRDNYQPIQDWRIQPFVMACESTALNIRDNEAPGASKESEVLLTCPTSGE